MKHWYIYGLILALSMPACKKGDDDPFLSLRTRKNRLSGYWELTQYNLEKDFGNVASEEFDAEQEQKVITYADSSEERRTFGWAFDFQTDGTYTSWQDERFTVDTTDTSFSYTVYTEIRGDWEFTGGNGEPNKSQLLLLPSEVRVTRSDQGSNISIFTVDGQKDGEVYDLDRLSNEDLWMSYKITQSFAFDQQNESLTVRFKKVEGGRLEEN